MSLTSYRAAPSRDNFRSHVLCPQSREFKRIQVNFLRFFTCSSNRTSIRASRQCGPVHGPYGRLTGAYRQQQQDICGCSQRSHSECGTGDHMTGCLAQSPATITGSAPAGSPWAFWCPLHACDRPVYGLSILLHGRFGTASSNSLASPRASAEYVAVDVQNATAQTTMPSACHAVRYPSVAWMYAAGHTDQSQPRHTRASYCIASQSWTRLLIASRSGPQKFVPSIRASRSIGTYKHLNQLDTTPKRLSALATISWALQKRKQQHRLGGSLQLVPHNLDRLGCLAKGYQVCSQEAIHPEDRSARDLRRPSARRSPE